MAFDKQQVRSLYRRRAGRYDFTANLYYLMGFREWAYRKKAVEALGLSRGDTVVEVGCGTGLNFPLLQDRVGAEGRIIGVDLTEEMLDQARERVRSRGWTNVDLVQSDAAAYSFPEGIHGILSTFALTLVPEYDEVIRRGARALAPGGRWVVADLKLPDGFFRYLIKLMLPAFRPFGVTLDLADRHPWEALQQHLGEVTMDEVYLGAAYIAAAEKHDEKGEQEGTWRGPDPG